MLLPPPNSADESQYSEYTEPYAFPPSFTADDYHSARPPNQPSVEDSSSLPCPQPTEHLELTVTLRLENGIRLDNKTNQPVETCVSTVSANASKSWERTKLQTITVTTVDGMSAACLVGPCCSVTVTKVNSVHPLTYSKEEYLDGRIRVHNNSSDTIAVCVSKKEGDSGCDGWFDIAPNTCDDWKRSKTQDVVVKTRSGASYGYYLAPGHRVTYDPVV
ncbi:hypothetical protein BCR33DRAFT_714448 [Rhizoclosmatium globosum]|uniref:Uncharacterized protein n=1 Tax=Rhizoclosmatium globosum TaxID=329046 RepID=A0A1Y2CNW0_9FUNG|nr:hypothetical protein BCR33DRAFT_714448 [Rhizoclosmatium globosum]|eukprot:ORY48729.1 hypothetical protein BCR33DRAFT_714448 [Rhizoclosmatium globosum]